MKILLYGEISGFFNNLSKGLKYLGHDTTVLSFGEGYKKIKGDINLGSKNKNIILSIFEKLRQLFFLIKCKNYDVILFSNVMHLDFYFINLNLLRIISKRNKKIFFLASGQDPVYYKYAKKIFKYSPFHNDINIVESPPYKIISKRSLNLCMKLIKNANAVIPITNEYKSCYEQTNLKNVTKVIEIPFSTSAKESRKKISSNNKSPLVIHGITRRASKGSEYILKALEKLKKDNICSVKIIDKISYKNWIEELDNADILVDQCLTQGYGMNTLLGLKKGLIVLCSYDEKYQLYKNSPVIKIKPNSENIYNALKESINIFYSDKYDPTLYLKNHDPKKIARDYIKVFKSY